MNKMQRHVNFTTMKERNFNISIIKFLKDCGLNIREFVKDILIRRAFDTIPRF